MQQTHFSLSILVLLVKGTQWQDLVYVLFSFQVKQIESEKKKKNIVICLCWSFYNFHLHAVYVWRISRLWIMHPYIQLLLLQSIHGGSGGSGINSQLGLIINWIQTPICLMKYYQIYWTLQIRKYMYLHFVRVLYFILAGW